MGGIILSCEELDRRLCGAGMRMIRTMGGGAVGACREYRDGAGDVAKREVPQKCLLGRSSRGPQLADSMRVQIDLLQGMKLIGQFRNPFIAGANL